MSKPLLLDGGWAVEGVHRQSAKKRKALNLTFDCALKWIDRFAFTASHCSKLVAALNKSVVYDSGNDSSGGHGNFENFKYTCILKIKSSS